MLREGRVGVGGQMHKRTTPKIFGHAKELHRNMSLAEAKLWKYLRVRAGTEREIKMSNFKKVLILIVILSIFLPLQTVSADLGPKPTMDFEFQQQTPGAALTILSGTLYECSQPDCQDAAPLQATHLQFFSCESTSCHATAYGFNPYHRLEVRFSDGKTRQSNVFKTAQFKSVYKVTIRTDDLLVEPQFSPEVSSTGTWLVICGCLGCLVGILVVVILLAISLIRRSRKKN